MKKFLLLTTLFLAPILAQADLTIVQNVESTMMNGPTTMKIKGDMMRVDSPLPGGLGNATTIIDSAKGKTTVLMHSQKMAMETDLGAVMKQAQGVVKDAEKPKATGQSEKVGDWNADIYTLNVAGMAMKFWVAKDFPNAAAVKEQMNKLQKLMAGSVDLSKFDLPGMTVKTEMTMPQGKMTSTIVSVKEGPVADSEFAIPADYKKMAIPTGAAGQ